MNLSDKYTGTNGGMIAAMLTVLGGALKGKKTYTVAAVAVIAALSSYFLGEISAFEGIVLGLNAVLAATLRHGVVTETANAVAAAASAKSE